MKRKLCFLKYILSNAIQSRMIRCKWLDDWSFGWMPFSNIQHKEVGTMCEGYIIEEEKCSSSKGCITVRNYVCWTSH